MILYMFQLLRLCLVWLIQFLCWFAFVKNPKYKSEKDVNEKQIEHLQANIEAAKKYALAIVDTCNKYNIDGFDYDIEDWGTLMNSSMPSVPNAFMKTLREEFDKTGKMLVADIPGGAGWLSFYEVLSEETVRIL